jgi:NhaP-type Na+/H+ or K+/H+ antiporter
VPTKKTNGAPFVADGSSIIGAVIGGIFGGIALLCIGAGIYIRMQAAEERRKLAAKARRVGKPFVNYIIYLYVPFYGVCALRISYYVLHLAICEFDEPTIGHRELIKSTRPTWLFFWYTEMGVIEEGKKSGKSAVLSSTENPLH